jgi:cytoskeletal protein CcmA (bactofilin family)
VRIWAGNVILEGGMDEHSSIECTQWLELGGQAKPHPRQLRCATCAIAAGAAMQFKYKLQVHHLELFGELEADIEAAGLVSIREGGHLKGTVRGAHLQVEEGGGLSARVFIWPQGGIRPRGSLTISMGGHIHVAGVAGVGMSALAQALSWTHARVTGSDRYFDQGQELPIFDALRAGGVES